MRLGTALPVRNRLPDLIEQVQLVNGLGYDSLWVPEVRGRDAFTTCALLAPYVTGARLGTGIVPLPLRSPVLLAMSTAALVEATGGRFVLGIGRGHVETTGPWYGADRPTSLAETRRVVEIVTAILTTGAFEGADGSSRMSFRLDGAYPQAAPPILLAATGPRSAALGGEMANGVILNWVPPEGAARLAAAAREGAEKAGGDPDLLEIAAFVPVCVTEDLQAAATSLSRQVAAYARLAAYRDAMAASGLADEVGAVLAGDPAPAHLLDAVGAFGTAETVTEKLTDFVSAGVTLPIIAPFVAGDDPWGSLVTTWSSLSPR